MDESALAAAQGFVGLTQEEITAALAEDATPLADLINGWGVDGSVSYEMTPELADAFSAQAGLAIPASGTVGVILADGILYADLSEFAALGAPEGWLGIPVGELLQAQIDAGVFAQAAAQVDPANLDAATATTLGLTNMLSNPQMFEQFMSVEKTEADGGSVFTTSVDVGAFVASPEFSEILMGLADAGVFAETGLTAADIEANLPMVGMMAPMIFGDLVVGSSTTVDADNFVTNSSTEFSWDLAGLLQMAATTGALPPELNTGGPMSISLTTSVDNADFNVEQMIEAPADATMIPAEAFYAQPAQ
jgi:hypothetical protein